MAEQLRLGTVVAYPPVMRLELESSARPPASYTQRHVADEAQLHPLPVDPALPAWSPLAAARDPWRGRGRRWMKIAALVVVLTLVAVWGVAAAALLAVPDVRLDSASDALARVVLPGFAGRVTAVDVRSAAGGRVPVQLRQGSCGRCASFAPVNG